MRKLLLWSLALFSLAAFGQRDSVFTQPPLSGNVSGFTLFTMELTSTTPINIVGLGANLANATTNMEIWYRVGGVESTPGQAPVITAANGWIEASPSGGIPLTAGTAVQINVPPGFSIPVNPGVPVGLFIRAGLRYSSATTPFLFSDANLTINMDNGKTYAGGTFPNVGTGNRKFQGWLTYELAGPCTSPPIPGTTIATVSQSCAGQDFTLSLDGATAGTGQTFQWQSSPDGINWSNVVGATGATLLTNQTSSNFYRCEVTCSGVSATSTPLLLPAAASAMSGTFTINSGSATGGTNFQSFNDLISELNCRGVGGAVTVNVAPNSGPYNEQVIIEEINGTSATNTITINGNGNTLEWAALSTSERTTLMLDGTDYLTIDNLKIEATGLTWGWVMQLMNGADHNTFTNCEFVTSSASTSTFFSNVVMSNNPTSATATGNAGSFNTFENNIFDGGYYGITIMGTSSTDLQFGNKVNNNVFKDFALFGIYMRAQEDIEIVGNDISRSNRSTVSTFYGIYMATQCPGALIANNQVHDIANNASTTTGSYAFYATTSPGGTATKPIRLENNAFYNLNSDGLHYTIYILGTTSNWEIYHNTISVNNPTQSGSSTIAAVYFSGAATSVDLRNNIFYIDNGSSGTQYGLWFANTGSTVTSNNNVIHNTSTSGIAARFGTTNYSSLNDWQTSNNAGPTDANSVDADPLFADLVNGVFTPLSGAVNNIGAPVGVLTDIFGNTRSTTTPDAGAVEFTPVTSDLALIGGSLLRGECLTTSDTASFEIVNILGTAVDFTTDPTSLTWNVSGPINSNGVIPISSGTLASGDTLTVQAFTVDMSAPGIYELSGFIAPSTHNSSPINDSVSGITASVNPLITVNPTLDSLASAADTVEISAMSRFFPAPAVFISEISHFKTTTGAPVNGWGLSGDHPWLVADDYIEITGVAGYDLEGWVLEQWSTSALQGTHTFNPGTVFSPNGTMVVAVGQLGSSVEDPTNFYYHGNGTFGGTYGSATAAGRILYDPAGNIVDAVGYGNYQFPAAANVPASEWSNPVTSATGSGTSGFRLIGPDVNSGTNWVISSLTDRQDPNTVNVGTTNPSLPALTGFEWTLNGAQVSTNPRFVAGPFPGNGIYNYVANYVTPCGTLTETSTIVVGGGSPCLSGTVTINAAQPTAGTNYASFNDLVTDLDSFGVCGPLTVDVVAGSGPYTERVVMGEILGADSVNTITINGNGNTLGWAALSTTERATLLLDGTDYLTIDNLRIEANGTSWGFVMHLINSADHNTFTNCEFVSSTTSTSTFFANVVMSGSLTSATLSGNSGNFNTFDNNLHIGGYYGITLNGNGNANLSQGNKVTNSTFEDFYLFGGYIRNQEDLIFDNNDITRATRSTVSTFYGIYFIGDSPGAVISNNQIHDISNAATSTASAYGIYATSVPGTAAPTKPIRLVNNAIYNMNTSGLHYTIYILGITSNWEIYHNTIATNNPLQTGTSTIANVYFSGAASNIDIRNNIFYIDNGSGGAQRNIWFANAASTVTSNNNAFFNTNPNGVVYRFGTTDYATLGDWQTANLAGPSDANSAYGNPVFADIANGNFTPLGPTPNNIGAPLGIADDIFGNSRSNTTPDAGAVEFTPVTSDLALISGNIARGSCLSNADTVLFEIENVLGGTADFTTDPISVAWNISGPVNSNGTIQINSGTLAPAGILSVFANTADLSLEGQYELNAHITPSAFNLFNGNDTLGSFTFNVSGPIFRATPDSAFVNNTVDSVEINLISEFFPAPAIFISEICHFKTATGAPVNGWGLSGDHPWLVADDYIEITGVPGFDLSGWVLEQWSTSGLQGTHTFNPGTVFSPNGTMVVAVGQLGSSVEDPTNFYYHGNGTFGGTYGSATAAGRILYDPSGNIVDAVGYGNYNFPASANVPASEWSNPLTTSTGSGTSGFRLTGPDVNSGTNWVVTSATDRQDPNTVNAGTSNPTLPPVTGISWTENGVAMSQADPTIVVGPFSTPGTYAYTASYNSPCGLISSTSYVIVDIPACQAPTGFSNNAVGVSTADFSWLGPTNADGYVLSYGPPGFNPNTVDPLAFWDFNDDTRFARNGSGLFDLIGGATQTFVSGFGSTDPAGTNRAINTSNYPAQGTMPKTTGVEIRVSTEGMAAIALTFDQRLSATASNTWVVQYTTDITASTPVWVDAATFIYSIANAFETRNVDFSSVTALNNNPNAAFRIVSDFEASSTSYGAVGATSTYGSGGTSRFDMVSVTGSPTGLSGNTTNVTANNGTATGLDFGTSYDVYVRSYCGSSFSSWTGPLNITTDVGCPPGAICGFNTTEINSDGPFATTGDTSSCPGVASVIIPQGQVISRVDVVYDVTAQGGAWMSEQRSFVMSPTNNAGEPMVNVGSGNSAGTLSYLRQNLNFANGLGGQVDFQLHLTRTWPTGTPLGCNTTYQVVPDSGFMVVVYTEPGLFCPPNAVCATNPIAVGAPIFDASNANWLSACPGEMSVIIPPGNEITGVDISYDVTAGNGAWMSEQRSFLYVPVNTGREATVNGIGNAVGAMNYSRTGLNIANGLTGTVDFELHLGRTWPSSSPACENSYQNIVDSTIQLIVYYGPATTCAFPIALAVDSLTDTEVSLSWTSSAGNFIVEYGATGFTPGTGTSVGGITGNATTITGLSANTAYDFYVRAICSPGDTSNAAGPVNATTNCAVFTAPFFEDFEATSTSLSCWTVSSTSTPPRNWSIGTGAGGGLVTTAFSGTQNARHTSTSGGPHQGLLYSPIIDLSSNPVNELSFYYAQEEWFSDQNFLNVYYFDSPSATAQLVFSDSTEKTSWTLATVTLPGNSATAQLVFEGIDNWGHAVVVDDVYMGPPTATLDPFTLVNPADSALILVAGPAQAPIIIDWTSAGAGATYEWQAVAPGGNFATPIAALPSDNGGADTTLSLTVGAVDALLASLGVGIGDTVSIEWSVRAIGGTDTLYATAPHYLTLVRFGAAAPILKAAPQYAVSPGNTGLSGPTGTAANVYFRAAQIILPTEYADADISNGDGIRSVSFTFNTLPTAAFSGRMQVYLQNSTDGSYLKNNVWNDIVNGMTLVFDDTITIPVGATQFDMPVNQNFVYSGGSMYMAFDWEQTSTPNATGPTYRSNTAVTASIRRQANATAPPPTLAGSSAFRLEVLWGVDRPADDLEVQQVFARGSNPEGFGYPEVIQVVVRNNGYLPASKTVDLNITGANTFTASLPVVLNSAQSTTINFTGFTAANLGFNTVTASVPADDVPTNNSRTYIQETTTDRVGYADTSVTGLTGVGYNTGSGLLLSRYVLNSARAVTDVRVRLSDNAPSVGNVVYGVVLDTAGTIVAQSAPFTIGAADLQTYVTFQLINPAVFNANEPFFVGLAQTASAGAGYFPAAVQGEDPTRADAYFTGALTGGAPSPIANFRFMVDAIIGSPCLDPDSVSVSGTTCTDAMVTWVSGALRTASAIEYGPVGFTPGTGFLVGATSPATLTGLVAGTNYELYVMDSCGSGTSSGWTGPVAFSTSPLPVASFTSTQTGASATGVDFDFDASASTNATSYDWLYGDGGLGTGVTSSHTYNLNGTYTVTLIVTGDCGTDTTTQQLVVSGIGLEDLPALTFNIFPNPTKGVATVTGLVPISGGHMLEIVDGNGRVAFKAAIPAGKAEEQLDLSGLPAGTYQVRISNERSVITKPLVISR
jgi:hypothetical protein